MRVISGKARHIPLVSSNRPEMQPTIDRIKEAIFSKLQFEIGDKRVLDLFAGSGQLGIEALSRGAAFCDFVDNSRDSVEAIKKNITKCGFTGKCAIHENDAFAFLKVRIEKYGIIFLDPPFHSGIIERILPLMGAICEPDAIIYCETFYDESLPEQSGNLYISGASNYGRIKTVFYKMK